MNNYYNLYWRTLSQYARLISGSATEADRLKDGADKTVEVSQIKFIPVKMSWRGQSWLGPYILAHTTTKWWNHSVQINIPVKIHDQKNDANKATLKCIPKAATVYVPGSFKYICLVIVDVVESSFPQTERFYIGNTYQASYAGNTDFGKIGHKIIGRNVESPAIAATLIDCMAAWKVMCKGLLSHVKPSAIEIRLTVLTTSRFAGFSVWTDEAKPKSADADEYASLIKDLDLGDMAVPETLLEWLDLLKRAIEEAECSDYDDEDLDQDDPYSRDGKVSLVKALIDAKFGSAALKTTEKDHIAGVTCMDPKEDIKIGDHTVPDWFVSYNTTATMPDRVKLYTWWRVDPLHLFSLGLVSCADGSKPAMEKFLSGEIQYELTEATDLIRIMSYSDIYLDNSACSGAIVEPIDILNRSLGFGGLLLAITELWRTTTGLSLLDFNRVASSWKLIDPSTWDIVGAATNNFTVISPSSTNTAWTDKTFGLLTLVKSELGVTDDKWLEHWYGGVVPWWFVQAVLLKFGGGSQAKNQHMHQCPS